MELVIIIIVVVFIVVMIRIAIKKKPRIDIPNLSDRIHCEKCGSYEFRFLWDKQLVADNKHVEVVPSGFSNRTTNHRGATLGLSKRGWGVGLHGGRSDGHSAHYRYKDVSVKVFRISCKCQHCGAVWLETVSEDAYPEIKKIPTMK